MKNKLMLFFLILMSLFYVKAENEATLKKIEVNKIECKCIEYNCTVEVNSSKATITYELQDSSASVDRQSGFQVDLTSLSTLIKLTVSNTVNGEKIENTYSIVITKHDGNSDNTIKSLSVNDMAIEILPEVVVYPYHAKYDEKKIIIKAETNDPKAKIITEQMEFDFDLERTSESFDFVVEAENKETLTYRVFVTRDEKPDTSLKNIKLDHGNILFNSKIYEYSFNVEYNVNNLNIEAIPNNSDATVKVEKKDLIVGENVINITVNNKKAESVYKLIVTREENIDKSVANLKSLEIKEYNKLDFDSNVLEYNLYFNEIPSFLTIKALPIDDTANVEIINNKELMEDDHVIIKVTIPDKNITREYSLNILKKTINGNNKIAVLITLIILVITIIILFIIEWRSNNKKKRETIKKIKEMNKKKDRQKKESKEKKVISKKEKIKEEVKEEEIEII